MKSVVYLISLRRYYCNLASKKYEVNLSTRPEKSVGTDDVWEKATNALRDALDDKGWAYQIDDGGGAFYGPKIDIKIEDALGRKWQCSTVQASSIVVIITPNM